MAARVLDAPSRDRLARRSVCTTAASSDTRVDTAPPLSSVAARHASLFQRSSAARAPSRSSSNVPPFAHPFGCAILEGFSIRFRRGLFYLVTTLGIGSANLAPPCRQRGITCCPIAAYRQWLLSGT